MSVLLKLAYNSVNPNQNPSKLFCGSIVILKCIWKDKKSRIANTTLRERNKVKELTFSDVNLLYNYSNQDSVVLGKE